MNGVAKEWNKNYVLHATLCNLNWFLFSLNFPQNSLCSDFYYIILIAFSSFQYIVKLSKVTFNIVETCYFKTFSSLTVKSNC